MGIFSDWHFWVACSQILLTLGIIAFQFFSHQKIVGNDLHHLSTDVKKVSDKVDSIDKKIDKQEISIAILKEKTKDL